MLDKTVMFNIRRYKIPEDDLIASLPSWQTLQHEQQEAKLSESYENLCDFNNELSECVDIIKFNVVEYISGFVVRSIFKNLNCEECLVSLTEKDVSSYISLISCKNRGGLV